MKKINLVVPLAGKAKRFIDQGVSLPKPLIMAGDRMIIDRTMECIDYSCCNLIFIVRSEHVSNFAIDEILKKKFGKDCKIVVSHKDTSGSVSSVMLASHLIDNDLPLVVHCSDVWFETISPDGKFDPSKISLELDGHLLVFKSNSSNYSYVEIDSSAKVVRTAEKTVISNFANSGIYYFKTGKLFCSNALEMIGTGDSTLGEFFIAPLYNHIIKNGNRNITVEEVKKMHIFGTPKELDFYVTCVLNKFCKSSVVALCSDHSGYDLKERAKEILTTFGIKSIDYGCYTSKPSDYVDFASLAAKSIQEKNCTHAMAFCSSANGVNMTGNKHKGIRGTIIYDEFSCKMAIEHSCSNWFSFPSQIIDGLLLKNMIQSMLDVKFQGGRHQQRLMKLMEI